MISTVNVQHLESLNDVVERITGMRQQETVPDEVVRAAEQVELVDITPEALRRRLAHGNVYAAERIDASLANYFRPGNLIALRELALLWVADEVDVALQRYRADERSDEIWETRERVVVALTGGPESETVLRRAARIAKRAGAADLLSVHVLRGDGLARRPGRRDARLRRLAKDVGRRFHTVVAARTCRPRCWTSPAGSTPPSWSRHLAALPDRADARAGHRGAGRAARRDDRRAPGHPRRGRARAATARAAGSAGSQMRRSLGWAAGAVVLPACWRPSLGVALQERSGVHRHRAVLPGHRADRAGGRTGPGARRGAGRRHAAQLLPHPAAVHLAIAEPRTWWPCCHGGGGGAGRRWWSTGRRGAPSRPPRRGPRARCWPRSRGPCSRAPTRCRGCSSGCGRRSGCRSVALLEQTAGDQWLCVASSGPAGCEPPDEADVDVDVEEGLHLVGSGRTLDAADRRLLEVVGGQALLALRSQRAAAQAEDRGARAEATETAQRRCSRRSATTCAPRSRRSRPPPPACATRTCPGRRRPPGAPATIEESADRLTALVDNLLDSSRLATGAVTPLLTPVGYDEVGDTRHWPSSTGQAASRSTSTRHSPTCSPTPACWNASSRTSSTTPCATRATRRIALRASAHDDRVELRIVDTGPGVPKRERESLFTPFQRLGTETSDRDGRDGRRAGTRRRPRLHRTMGGTLTSEDTPGGGLTVVVSLPAAYTTAAVTR